MYGTVYRMQPRQGQAQAVLDHLFRWEQEHLPGVAGYAGGYVFEPTAPPGAITMIVAFESQATYIRNRDNPQQELWDRRLRELLEYDLECNEGDITEIRAEPHGL